MYLASKCVFFSLLPKAPPLSLTHVLLASFSSLLFSPLEIAKTSRYTHFTGKNELGVFARADIKAGTRLFPYLAGDCAPFTAQDSEMDTAADSDLVWEKDLEEDGEAQQAESSAMGAGRRPQRSAPAQQAAKDFSVYYSTRNRREEFFLGTARFVNVSFIILVLEDESKNCAEGEGGGNSTDASFGCFRSTARLRRQHRACKGRQGRSQCRSS